MSARDIYPSELLRLAEELAGGVGPGRPHTVSLRHAVSLSYYALFHRISRDIALGLLGTAKTSEAHSVVRWVTHADLELLCKQVGKPSSNLGSVLSDPSAELTTLSVTFTDLQDERHRADYDHGYDITRTAAKGLVRRSAEAVALADAMRHRRDLSYLRFRRLALGAVKIAKNRA